MWIMESETLLKQRNDCMKFYGYSFANLIKAHRKQTGESQGELGAKLNTHASVVNQWETGCNLPSIEYVSALCNILQVHPIVMADMLSIKGKKKEDDSAFRRFIRIMAYAMGSRLAYSPNVSTDDIDSERHDVELYKFFYGLTGKEVNELLLQPYDDFSLSIIRLYDCYTFAHTVGVNRVARYLCKRGDTILDTTLMEQLYDLHKNPMSFIYNN